MAVSLTVGLTPRWDFSACCWEMKRMPSIRCLCNLDNVPDFFFFPEVLGHQQIVGYRVPPFWLIIETSFCNHFHFPTPFSKLPAKKKVTTKKVWLHFLFRKRKNKRQTLLFLKGLLCCSLGGQSVANLYFPLSPFSCDGIFGGFEEPWEWPEEEEGKKGFFWRVEMGCVTTGRTEDAGWPLSFADSILDWYKIEEITLFSSALSFPIFCPL